MSNKEVTCTLIGDGSSDKMLVHPIKWLMDEIFVDYAVNVEFGDSRGLISPSSVLSSKIEQALDLFPCDILFIHRDAEKQSLAFRNGEIVNALSAISHPGIHFVPVIPVRMTEAWFLHDEKAIRIAAGNPNGSLQLNLPNVASVDRIPNPKQQLEELLKIASELNKRRRRGFKPRRLMHRLAELTEDFSVLRSQESFRALEAQIVQVKNSHFADPV